MEVFEGEKHLGSVELGLPERELLALNVQHEVATTDVFHNEVDTGLSLETRVQPEKEWMAFTSGRQKYSLF